MISRRRSGSPRNWIVQPVPIFCSRKCSSTPKSRGRDYIDRLYEEHRAGRDLLTRVLVLKSDSWRRLGDEEQARLLQQAEMMLDHAVSCGTLLSYLTTLDQTTQQKYFAALLALRQQAKRWTEIPEPAPGQDHGQVTSPIDSPELPETT